MEKCKCSLWSATGMKDVKNDEGVLIQNQEAADYMNNFYISAGPKLTNHIPKTWRESDFKLKIDATSSQLLRMKF